MNDDFLDRFAQRVGVQQPGSVSVVGVGPGDSGLLTVKGMVRLGHADLVLHDLPDPAPFDALTPAAVEWIHVGFDDRKPRMSPDEILELIASPLQFGRRIVRLKSGDPFIYNRGDLECLAFAAAGVLYEVVPGVTAAIGAAAYAGIPVTLKNCADVLTVVLPRPYFDVPIDYAALANQGSLAIYLAEKNLDRICKMMIDGGVDPATPAVVVERATLGTQRTVEGTVGDIAAAARGSGMVKPALTLIGRAVARRGELQWFESRPLFGQCVVNTRPVEQSASLVGMLSVLGAEVLDAPSVSIQPLTDYRSVDDALRRLDQYDWVVLTSANGVDALGDRLRALKRDARSLATVRLAAIGPATAERLERLMLRADVVPDEYVAEDLARALTEHSPGGEVRGQRVLLLRSDIARPALPESLRDAGAVCEDVSVYRTTTPEKLPEYAASRLCAGTVDWITFTSSSTFENFRTLMGDEAPEVLQSAKLASIGPITSRTMRQAGYEPTVEAKSYTVAGLVEVIRSGSAA